MFVYVNKDDLRSICLSEMYLKEGVYVSHDLKDLEYADVIYLGMRGIDRKNRLNQFDETLIVDVNVFARLKKGTRVITIAYNDYLNDLSKQYGFKYLCLNKNDYFVDENSMLCAEGLLAYIIRSRPYSLLKSKVIVFGSGHIAKMIIELFINMKIDVSFCARENRIDKKVAFIQLCDHIDLSQYDVVVNTIPSQVISKNMIDTLRDDALIVDVSSFPYGLDHHYALSQLKNANILSSIPGKYAYHYGAYLIKKVIEDDMNEE